MVTMASAPTLPAATAADRIRVRGVRVHNLQDVDLDIPHNRLVVITGPSGSGKSSLAFDTLHAEGQRQYVESLSAYARQFFHQYQRPDADLIEGLPPTVSIDQRTGGNNPRSTVGTITEVHDYLRLLFARAGTVCCPACGQPVSQQSPEEIQQSVEQLPAGTKVMILAPMVRGRRGKHEDVLAAIRKAGFVRARVDGHVVALDDEPAINPRKRHHIEAVVDRIIIREGIRNRLGESLRLAIRHGDGLAMVSYLTPNGGPTSGSKAAHAPRRSAADGAWSEQLYSTRYACPSCNISLAELEPRLFSFNSPYGACPNCEGLGYAVRFDLTLVIPDTRLSLADGAVAAWRGLPTAAQRRCLDALQSLLDEAGVDASLPVGDLASKTMDKLWHGNGPRRLGIATLLEKEYATCTRRGRRQELESYRSPLPCEACDGSRLRPEARAVTVGGRGIHEVSQRTSGQALEFFDALDLPEPDRRIAGPIIDQIVSRLRFLEQVGAHYLTLDRAAESLSGGEMQRVRLATGIGSGLVGVCYLLDEPTVGLHPRDNQRLIDALRHLQRQGNTVVVVEHDAAMMKQADHIVDMGPGAGQHGGKIVAEGPPQVVAQAPASVTGRYLSGTTRIPLPVERRRTAKSRSLQILGAATNNLRNVDVRLPLAALVCVTGVSGSGKSSLVRETLAPAVGRRLGSSARKPGPHRGLRGVNRIDRLVEVDQSPIGRTPRSNAATYTGLFDDIRKVFCNTRLARQRGYRAGRFSFNVKGGRCETCQGQGQQRIEMSFLPDLYATCPDCDGARFNRQTLQVKFRGLSIADVLGLQIDDALETFENFPTLQRILNCLKQVGLGYLRLGQPATTLSGGEAQRVRLASELARPTNKSTLYVLDEPTTGLHFVDIQRLLSVLQRLVDLGNTVVVIEHHLDVIKSADWIVDLGPGGGDDGGRVTAEGTPEEVAATPDSYTGQYLQPLLDGFA